MKRIVLAFAGSIIATGAMAQSVSSTKEAPKSYTLFDKAYGGLEIRHQVNRYYQGDDRVSTTPYLEPRFTLGSKLFKDKLDVSVTHRTRKYAQTAQLKTLAPEFYAVYDASTAKFGTFNPYILMYPKAFEFSEDYYQFGMDYATPALERSTAIGTVSAVTVAEVSTTLYGQEKKTTEVTNGPDHFGIMPTTTQESVKQEQPEYAYYINPSVSLKPTAVKGLKLSAGVRYLRLYSPVYAFDSQAVDGYSFDSYNDMSLTENLIGASYQVNDLTTINNTVYIRTEGFYDKRMDKADGYGNSLGGRVSNRLTITHNLF